MALASTIAGSPVQLQPSFQIGLSASASGSFSGSAKSISGSYRPTLRDEIIMTDGSDVLFGGYLTTCREQGLLVDNTPSIETKISATDYKSLTDRRAVVETIPAGTLKAALLVLVDYLTDYGVTLDVGQVDGPSLPDLAYDYRKLTEVLGELATLSGYVWEIDSDKVLRMYAPGSLSAPFNITDGNCYAIGDVTVEVSSGSAASGAYANRVIVRGGTTDIPVTAQADDAGDQTAYGLWEVVIAAPTATDATIAQALADAYLIQHLPTPKIVRYQTYHGGVLPGRVQTITVANRNINNTFLVTDVQIRNDGRDVPIYSVTAIEGTVLKQTWRDTYRQWSGGLTTAFAVVSSANAGRTVFYLGASEEIWVQSATPTWVACGSGVQVSIDPATRGTSSATVTVRLRSRSGDVTARLRNLTTNATVGTSSTVTNTSLETVTFSVTLTAGLNIYELQILPTVANEDCQAVGGYLE